MSFRLYVGNYPCNFTRQDVENLFRDFDGVTVEKICKRDLKCFSFVVCRDIDQLVSVIQKMNDTSVSGRQLKVRASDESLQEYVNLILQEANDDENSHEDPSLVPLQVMRNKRNPYEKHEKNYNQKFENRSNYTSRSSQNNYQKYKKNGESLEKDSCYSPRALQNSYQYKYEEDIDESFERNSYCSPRSSQNGCQQKYEKATGESFENSSWRSQKSHKPRYERDTDGQFEKSSYYTARSPQNNYWKKYDKDSGEQFEKKSCYHISPSKFTYQQRSENHPGEHFQEISCYSPSPSQHSYVDEHNLSSSEIDIRSPRNNYAKNLHQQSDSNTFTWVSVTNFPIGISIGSIYELFSDYDPVKVKMVCNSPRRDKTLTEAHVCFWNRDIANDVILNFDNTMFEGRLILVNDIEDLTIMNELLGVANI